MKRFFAFALFACAPAFAAVPNLFVAGQPARAEDMNRNLFYLDSATATKASLASVNTIQIAVSSLQSSKATQSALNDALKLIAAKVGSADLEKVLKGKVDTSTVRILGDLVAKKADETWVTGQIAASAPSGMLASDENLADLSDKAVARTNLGLGALAVKASLTAADVGALTGAAADKKYLSRAGDTLKGPLMMQGPLRDAEGSWILGGSANGIGIGSAAQGMVPIILWTGTSDTTAVFAQSHISLRRSVFLEEEQPLVFTGSGTGAFDRATLSVANSLNKRFKGVLLEIPRQKDASTAAPSDFEINVQGGGNQILRYEGSADILTLSRSTKIAKDLTVTGTINGKVVTNGILSTNVADYVFEPDYKLASLSEVEAYTKTHKHLPEVPSATEIEKNGLDLAQMNLVLLKKVEELTLHTIALEKRMKAMEAGDRAQ
ncbi:MAG: hypothetical protein IPN71_22665 [Fibrobacteres bacterium]|nr:hypothetical protein [Fibrobacterota bacterium]MBK9577112.1 hypothetical protein [Fibrobacterota bacterium]QQS06132.1 MAG: hypothetical protein IPK50_04380 [Fibrobacterota bacterium]